MTVFGYFPSGNQVRKWRFWYRHRHSVSTEEGRVRASFRGLRGSTL